MHNNNTNRNQSNTDRNELNEPLVLPIGMWDLESPPLDMQARQRIALEMQSNGGNAVDEERARDTREALNRWGNQVPEAEQAILANLQQGQAVEREAEAPLAQEEALAQPEEENRPNLEQVQAVERETEFQDAPESLQEEEVREEGPRLVQEVQHQTHPVNVDGARYRGNPIRGGIIAGAIIIMFWYIVGPILFNPRRRRRPKR
jgi:hypothetical protein